MRNEPKLRRFWLAGGWILLAISLYLALIPLPALSLPITWYDKVLHLVAFMGFMLWFSGLYPSQRYWRIFVLLMLYGILMEALQSQVPNRYAEFADLIADCVGAALGWAAALAGLRAWPAWLERLLIRTAPAE